jgi:hypothetical protein
MKTTKVYLFEQSGSCREKNQMANVPCRQPIRRLLTDDTLPASIDERARLSDAGTVRADRLGGIRAARLRNGHC